MTFLVWFLRNVYRLDDTDARDSICDHANDKGIDGIWVDHNNEEIHFFQSKIRQAVQASIGDVGLKNFAGSLTQFDEPAKIDLVLAGNADDELKRLLVRTGARDLVNNGYSVVGVYVTNERHNQDSTEYAKVTPALRIFDRAEIASRVIELGRPSSQKTSFTFDTSYVDPLAMKSGAGKDETAMYLFPTRALQLVHMEGIADGTLFDANVRYTLGNTAVNKSIRQSIFEKSTHGKFVLFHNGIIILCSSVDASVPGELTIKDYSVVNGAQSLTSFYNNKGKLSDELRVLVRVIAVQDEELASAITRNSNNQNAIRPRDLRSNHSIMVRLQKEVEATYPEYFFEIKRGEETPNGRTTITNDEVGRALLAFDLYEPWSAHQVYKVFDEKYAEIFGRPEIDAHRIVLARLLSAAVGEALSGLKNKPMASYALTRYFLLYVLGNVLRANTVAREYVRNPSKLTLPQLEGFVAQCGELLKTMVVDLGFEASTSSDFDYKSVLKSSVQASDLASRILASYEKDVARGKADSFDGWSPDA